MEEGARGRKGRGRVGWMLTPFTNEKGVVTSEDNLPNWGSVASRSTKEGVVSAFWCGEIGGGKSSRLRIKINHIYSKW
eukprot:760124-Hanusia_phi.AAC.4